MINGIINIYKEAGYTSNDVVCRMRGILRQKKIGHTGTLDPDAVGVLPVCLGSGTKLVELLTDHDKEYTAYFRLGLTTDTQDISGHVVHTSQVHCSESEIEKAVLSFVGTIEQLPPMYSAIKVNGKKLYEYARAGIEVQRKTRQVTIHAIEILEMKLPEVVIKVSCSKGTYIRTLCHDIGQTLGCGAVMTHLERSRVGVFEKGNAITLGQLEALRDADAINQVLIPVDEVLRNYPAAVPADAQGLLALKNGNPLPAGKVQFLEKRHEGGSSKIRLYDNERHFLALYRFDESRHCYMPDKMFLG